MERALTKLFDFQRFAGNPHLDQVIRESLARCDRRATALADDDLTLVNAAGTAYQEEHQGKPNQ